MTTMKLKLQETINITIFQQQYNNALRFAFNRLKKNISIKETEKLVKGTLKLDLLDASWIKDIVIDAQTKLKINPKMIFGSKNNFWKRKYKKITKKEFNQNRLVPIYFVGSISHWKGNRKFELDITKNDCIIFKPSRHNHIKLKPYLTKKQHTLLTRLQELAEARIIPITYKLDKEYIYIIYDESRIKQQRSNFIADRILTLDLNPNYIGLTICDWRSKDDLDIVYKEVISNRELVDKLEILRKQHVSSDNAIKIHLTNKKNFETFEISKYIINVAIHYKVEYLGVEKLSIDSKEYKKGKAFNRLINNYWNRSRFIQNINKRCNINDIKFLEILPQYSNFIGCLQYPNEPDMIAAALEINRRAYLFIKHYLKNDNKKKEKVSIVFPDFDVNTLPTQWKKMALNCKITNWKELYKLNKKMKFSFRLLLKDYLKDKSVKSLSLKSHKSNVKHYIL